MAPVSLVSLVNGRSSRWVGERQTKFQQITEGTSDSEWVHITMDELGDLPDVASTLGDGRNQSARVSLHLAPGMCLLRRLPVASLSPKQIDPALELWADESLPSPAEEYYLDSWVVDPKVRGLAAVPREPLSRARTQLIDAGGQLAELLVPELRPPADARSGVVCWATSFGLLACLWKDHVLYDWQSFVSGQPARAIVEQISVSCQETPAFVYLNGTDSMITQVRSELGTMWPQVEIAEPGSWERRATEHEFGAGLTFPRYLYEEQEQDATNTDKLRLGLVLSGVLMAGLFLFFAYVTQLQQQVEQLQHQMSLVKVRANRSEKVAARIGDTLRKVRELRAMTTERKGVMVVLKQLSESLPPRVKLDNFTVERDGMTALDGVAETELDISTMLERFRRSPMFRTPNLTFIQKDDKRDSDQALIRFRLETQVAEPLLSLPGAEEAEAAPS